MLARFKHLKGALNAIQKRLSAAHSKENFLKNNGFPILYRGHNERAEEILDRGIEAKGKNLDIKQHVDKHPADSNYVASSTVKMTAGYYGVGVHSLITCTYPSRFVNVPELPFVPRQNNAYTPDGMPESFGTKENEYAVIGKLEDEDIAVIRKRIGISYASITYDAVINPNHAPAAMSFALLSACQNQSEELEWQLKKLGILPQNKRIVHPQETLELDFGRISTDEIGVRKQVIVETVPADLPPRLLEEFLSEKHEKFQKKGLAQLKERLEKNPRIITPSETISNDEIEAFKHEAAEHWKNYRSNRMTFFKPKSVSPAIEEEIKEFKKTL